jgi:hypothetical protein
MKVRAQRLDALRARRIRMPALLRAYRNGANKKNGPKAAFHERRNRLGDQ